MSYCQDCAANTARLETAEQAAASLRHLVAVLGADRVQTLAELSVVRARLYAARARILIWKLEERRKRLVYAETFTAFNSLTGRVSPKYPKLTAAIDNTSKRIERVRRILES